jgi:uncharacterized protein YbjT (DUF2867 family)
MKFNAIIYGATGMVGEGVLHEALHHDDVASVLVIGRRSCGVSHPKLRELIQHDFFDYRSAEETLKGFDACFFCLGVSSVGMKEDRYTHITYDLTMSAATTLSRLNPGMTFCYVSGTGTDSTERGRIMWARVKGRTENHLMQLPFKSVYAFRPGFIKPTKGQRNAYTASRLIGVMYPLWKVLFPKYVCTMQDLGRAMIHAVTKGYPKLIVENKDIAKLANAIEFLDRRKGSSV